MRVPSDFELPVSEHEKQKSVEEELFGQEPKKKPPSRQKRKPASDPFYGVKVDLPPDQQLEKAWLALEASAAKWDGIDREDPIAVAIWAREDNTYRKSINKPNAFDPTLPLMPLVSIHTGREIAGFPLCLKDIYTHRRETLESILWNLGLACDDTDDELRTLVYVSSISQQYSFPEASPRHIQEKPRTLP
ncbi:hypothetical protein ACHAPA_006141 [Fusarium lateritium]